MRIMRYSQENQRNELFMFKKLLTFLILFTGFQVNAVVIGNLTYDGTYISGDGRTYLGLDTIASWDYARTFNATQDSGDYEDFRIANTADADYFIGSLFGADADNCSTVDGTWSNESCGVISLWTDGLFGDSYNTRNDQFFFIADEGTDDVGLTGIGSNDGNVTQNESRSNVRRSNWHADGGRSYHLPVGWLLVRDTVAAVPEPSILALMALGIFGIGFARRRSQS
jgi:hypothetical protein